MQKPMAGRKIGSMLAAFESNIQKNQEISQTSGSSESRSFVSSLASSTRKFRVAPRQRSGADLNTCTTKSTSSENDNNNNNKNSQIHISKNDKDGDSDRSKKGSSSREEIFPFCPQPPSLKKMLAATSARSCTSTCAVTDDSLSQSPAAELNHALELTAPSANTIQDSTPTSLSLVAIPSREARTISHSDTAVSIPTDISSATTAQNIATACLALPTTANSIREAEKDEGAMGESSSSPSATKKLCSLSEKLSSGTSNSFTTSSSTIISRNSSESVVSDISDEFKTELSAETMELYGYEDMEAVETMIVPSGFRNTRSPSVPCSPSSSSSAMIDWVKSPDTTKRPERFKASRRSSISGDCPTRLADADVKRILCHIDGSPVPSSRRSSLGSIPTDARAATAASRQSKQPRRGSSELCLTEQEKGRIAKGFLRAPSPARPNVAVGNADFLNQGVVSKPGRKSTTELSSVDKALIKKDLMETTAMRRKTPSPARRREQNAVRKSVAFGTKRATAPAVPARKLSDPVVVNSASSVTTSISETASALVEEEQRQGTPIDGGRNSGARKKSRSLIVKAQAFNDDYKRKIEEKYRDEARRYNAADHGLVGVLKWSPKKKNLRVRFARDLVSRRGSLDTSLNDKGRSNGMQSPKQPRRRSMSDGDEYENDTKFVEKNKASKAVSLFKAAVWTSMLLPSWKLRNSGKAIRLQAFARGFLLRLHLPVIKLERKLESIEKERLRDLDLILQWKWKRMESIRHDAERQFSELSEKATKAQDLVKYLREDNDRLEMRMKRVADSIDATKRLNKVLSESTKLLLNNFSTMSEAVDTLNDKNTNLTRTHAKFSAQLSHVKSEASDLNDRLLHETSIRESIEATLLPIMTMAKLRCGDAILEAELDGMFGSLRPVEVRTQHINGEQADKGFPFRSILDSPCSTSAEKHSFRSDDTIGSVSFANVAVDDDLMTYCTTDTFASGWTQ